MGKVILLFMMLALYCAIGGLDTGNHALAFVSVGLLTISSLLEAVRRVWRRFAL